MSRILVVEDESAIAELVAINLRHAGFEVAIAETADAAQAEVDRVLPELVVLDWMLPGQTGLALAKRWRAEARTRDLPIIMLTARSEEADKLSGLDAGADDYLTKPFGSAELMARIRVALRHASRTAQDPLTSVVTIGGSLRVDLAKRLVFQGETEVHLTPIEYKLLVALTKHAGMVLTHKQLLDQVWGPGHGHQMQYLRVYMAQLRQKLEENPAHPRYLVTEPGVGYRLKSEA
jgi:two-component system phosphate regulon response regulator PhoB